jgi:hypothetical protein
MKRTTILCSSVQTRLCSVPRNQNRGKSTIGCLHPTQGGEVFSIDFSGNFSSSLNRFVLQIYYFLCEEPISVEDFLGKASSFMLNSPINHTL